MQTPKEVSEALAISHINIKQRLLRMKNRGLIAGYGGKYWIENGVTQVTDVARVAGVMPVI